MLPEDPNTNSNIDFDKKLKQNTKIQVFFLSEEQKQLLSTIYDILESIGYKESVRAMFIMIQKDEDPDKEKPQRKAYTFCKKHDLDKNKFLELVSESLNFPAPKIENTKSRTKNIMSGVLAYKQNYAPLIERGFSEKSARFIMYYYEGITPDNIFHVLARINYGDEDIIAINNFLKNRRRLRSKKSPDQNQVAPARRVMNEFERSDCGIFFSSIFKYSNQGKEYLRDLES